MTEIDLRQILNCARCGACRPVCPVLEEVGWESSGTRGRMLLARRLSLGESPCPGDLESLNTCTTCGACSQVCPAGVNPPKVVEGVRRSLASRGFLSPEHAGLGRRIADAGNPLGDTSPRLGWLGNPGKVDTEVDTEADHVYFAGCLASYRFPGTARRTLDILRPFGLSPLAGEVCCGSPLIRTGQDPAAAIERNMEAVRRTGAMGIVTGCAGCYTTLKNDYPWDFDIEVKSVPEFLAERIDDLELKPLDITVTYHDPCHMGRQSGVFEPPRKVIRSICNLKEMKASKESSRCCGGGGGVRAAYGDLSLSLARRRLEDVPEGVDWIVTSCPMCVRNLSDAGGKVVDLVELVSRALAAQSQACLPRDRDKNQK